MPLTQRHQGSAMINRGVPMRVCARVALVLMIVASCGLAACGTIDDLRDTVSRWFDVGSPGRPGSADARPSATPMITTDSKKSSQHEASQASKKKDKLSYLPRCVGRYDAILAQGLAFHQAQSPLVPAAKIPTPWPQTAPHWAQSSPASRKSQTRRPALPQPQGAHPGQLLPR